MANDLMRSSSALAIVAAGDGFADAARESGSSALRGPKIKFTKGLYFKNGEPLATGTKFLVTGTHAEWCRWNGDDGPPAERRGRDAMGKLPDRADLGFTNEAEWPINQNGEVFDPWQLTRYLYLIDVASMEESTFVTTSIFGGLAV